MKAKEKFLLRRLEQGNVIDLTGSVFVVAFIFALILAYAGYGKIVQNRLSINRVAKEYLYAMEEYGYMSDERFDNFISDMEAIGVAIDATDVTNLKSRGELNEDGSVKTAAEQTDYIQVTYGDRVTLAFTAEFENPFFTLFTKEGGSMFRIMGYEETIAYDVVMSSTAKW